MKYKLMWSLWPAFLGACALELLFFGAIDPHALSLLGMRRRCSPSGFTLSAFSFFGQSALHLALARCFWPVKLCTRLIRSCECRQRHLLKRIKALNVEDAA